MRDRRYRCDTRCWPAVLAALLASGCGGGGSTPATPPPVEVVVVEADLAIDEVLAGSSLRLEAGLEPGESVAAWNATPDIFEVSWQGRTATFVAGEVERPERATLRVEVRTRAGGSRSGTLSVTVVPPFTVGAAIPPPYPLDVDPISGLSEIYRSYPVDAQGIVMDPQGRGDGYNPGVAARFATMLHRDAIAEDDSSLRSRGRAHAEWLVRNLDCDGRGGRWMYSFPLPPYTDTPGWSSAMTQAFGITALIQHAPEAPGGTPYLRAAGCALAPFSRDVVDGGVATPLGNSAAWYEEVAAPARSGHLNGMLFAMGGLHYAWKHGRSHDARILFERGLSALRIRLPSYDDGFDSLYNLLRDPATGQPRRAHNNYNAIHVLQLLWLHRVTGDPLFFEYAARFLRYEPGNLASIRQAGETGAPELAGSALHDEAKYWGEWSAAGQRFEFRVELRSPARPEALVLFVPGEEGALPQVSYACDDEPACGGVLGAPSRIDRHVTGNSVTTIYVLPFPAGMPRVDRLVLAFDGGTRPGELALRQLELHADDDGAAARSLEAEYARTLGW